MRVKRLRDGRGLTTHTRDLGGVEAEAEEAEEGEGRTEERGGERDEEGRALVDPAGTPIWYAQAC